jgi:transcriptional regulator with XRE-family HTH domain
MTKHGALEKYVRTPDEELKFAEETAMAQTALVVADLLASTNTTQRALAARVGVSEARVSQILCADSNPTVRTMARIGYAMGRRMVIEFKRPPMPREEPKPWPRRLHSVPLQWENTNDEFEPVAEDKLAG